ncbi:MAG: hypothetical protein ACI841_000056 [Planctomycetota bacterium]|jgi:hypothetical protein
MNNSIRIANRRALRLARWASLVVLPSLASAQSFVDNTSDIPSGSPSNASNTENVDFADVDLDGDWDAAFADGGDDLDDQNRLWINQGGAQGGSTGVFIDRTSTQFPSVLDQSRDIEFVDFDADGDSDIYVSNTSAITNQTNRWWVNQGGAQAGTLGFYQDDTAARWLGLGAAGSSIPPTSLIGSGGFIDWSCDCDFGDLDNDGDLDLVHSSYGGAFGGQVPTRIFLNDGAGFFTEFNPSGYQLPGTTIANGSPGLWCDGTHQSNTTNTTGAQCDIASTALDIDLGDIDGDFDLDILHGARQEQPRMFANRLEASALAPSAGGLGFRDVTNISLPAGWSSGNGHYEQEMADLDGDGDLDLYGLNWAAGFGFNDVTFRNTGNGIFDNTTTLSGSSADDNEGDFLDYDGDGDLDLYVCNFSGQDKLYRNDWNGTPGGGGSFSFTDVTSELPSTGFIGLDADAADLDGDGDYDLIVGNDNNARNLYLENVTQTPDASAPYLPLIESAADRVPGANPTVVRAHVYDNAPYYVTWYNETWVEVSVDGGALTNYPMISSGGQVFRAEIPGSLQGSIDYRAVSRDEHGNEGSSAWQNYESSAPCAPVNYCTAKLNSAGCTPSISYTGTPSATGSDDFHVTGTDIVSGQYGFLIWSLGPNSLPYFGGTLCISAPISRTPIQYAGGNAGSGDCSGSFSGPFSQGTMAANSLIAGSQLYFQYWYRDPGLFDFIGLTDGLDVVICP